MKFSLWSWQKLYMERQFLSDKAKYVSACFEVFCSDGKRVEVKTRRLPNSISLLKSVHFQNTVSRSSFLSKLWSFSRWIKVQKWEYFHFHIQVAIVVRAPSLKSLKNQKNLSNHIVHTSSNLIYIGETRTSSNCSKNHSFLMYRI